MPPSRLAHLARLPRLTRRPHRPRLLAFRAFLTIVILAGTVLFLEVGCCLHRPSTRVEPGRAVSPASAPAEAPVVPGAASASPTAPVTATPLSLALDSIFADPLFESAIWGVRVEQLDGTPLYDLNGAKLFLPASNLKIYTTAAALDLLSPEFTYTTRLEALGFISSEGRLQSDLLIVGSGDPSFGSWHVTYETNDSRVPLKDWIEKIRAAGIREIEGNIIGDGRVLVFSMMVNQNLAGLSKADVLIDKACTLLVTYSQKEVVAPAVTPGTSK